MLHKMHNWASPTHTSTAAVPWHPVHLRATPGWVKPGWRHQSPLFRDVDLEITASERCTPGRDLAKVSGHNQEHFKLARRPLQRRTDRGWAWRKGEGGGASVLIRRWRLRRCAHNRRLLRTSAYSAFPRQVQQASCSCSDTYKIASFLGFFSSSSSSCQSSRQLGPHDPAAVLLRS